MNYFDKKLPALQALTFLLIAIAFVPCIAQTAQTAAKPDRGAGALSSYALSEIENINLTNGNVNISIPLASLPPIAGGKLNFTLRAVYNSKLHDTFAVESRMPPGEAGVPLIYFKQIPRLSELGGWRINGRYVITSEAVEDDFVRLGDTGDPDLQHILGLHKTFLITPDGSRHELRPIDYPGWNGANPTYTGYYKEPNNVSVRYYSFDGSYLWVRINPLGSAVRFEVYQGDGTKITQFGDGIQRITDTNGNSIKIFDDAAGTHYQDELTGREIVYSEDSQGVGHVTYKTVTGISVTTDITFGSTTVRGKAYDITTFCSPEQANCQCTYQELYTTTLGVIREITLPATQSNQPRQKFTFSYNSDIDNPAPGTYKPSSCFSEPHPIPASSWGNGQLSEMRMPDGAVVKYGYGFDSISWIQEANNIASEGVTFKILEHDGTSDTWTYFITHNETTVTNPDNTTLKQTSYSHLPAYMSSMGGPVGLGSLVYRINRGGKELIERHWTRLKFSGGQEEAPGGGKTPFNPVIDFEYLSLLDENEDPIKMSAKAFQYDFNGNLLAETHYDWFDPTLVNRDIEGVPTGIPSSATVLSTTTYSYHNSAPTAASTNVYAKRALSASDPHILNALNQVINGPAIAQFSYDSQDFGVAPVVGNVTGSRVWDNFNNKWLASSRTYDSHGNVTTKTDPRGNITQLFYDDVTKALPTRVVIDPENGTGTQTTTTVYDFSTGRVLSQTDANENTTSNSYANHLLGTIDPFGRVGTTTGPLININGVNQRRKVKSFYEDHLNRVTVASDLRTEDDQLRKVRMTNDMLGRNILMEQSEDGTSYTIVAHQVYEQHGRIMYVSNVMRTNAATTDGWTRSTADGLGRVTEVASFGGAVKPPASGTNANWTGSVVIVYEGNNVTVTDQAGQKRSKEVDALGRAIKITEDPNGAGYQTTYGYDSLGNLNSVVQGGQNRTFIYDSLSLLRSAINPENGTTTYGYDDNGNLTTRADARPVTITMAYDSLNRPTSRSYSDGTPTVSYIYDEVGVTNSKGALTRINSSVANYAYSDFDATGKPGSATQTIAFSEGQPATDYSMEFKYNVAGMMTSERYPSGRVVKTIYDDAGRIAGVQNDASGMFYAGAVSTDSVNRIQYIAAGMMQEIKLGNNLWEHTKFNSRLQPIEIGVGTSATNSSKLKLDYSYGVLNGSVLDTTKNNGNVQSQTITAPGAAPINLIYEYDGLNRLRKAQEAGLTGWTQEFAHDRFGNRTSVTITDNPSFQLPTIAPEVDPNTNRLKSINSQGQTTGYEYDPAGNMTQEPHTGSIVKKYIYDGENRLREARRKEGATETVIARYHYDGSGRRVRTVVGSVTTVFVYNVSGQLIAEYSDGPAIGDGTSYITGDMLASTRLVTGSNGQERARYDYLPFGELIPTGYGNRSAVTGYGLDKTRQKFTAKERDNEIGLDYFFARYYSSTQARFTSVDPDNAGADESDPQSWNGYAYARNNPNLYSDPDGRTFKICYQGGGCHDVTDEQFNKMKADATKLGSVFKDNKIYNEVDGQIVATASYTRTWFDDLDDKANLVIFGSKTSGAGLVDRLKPVQQVIETGFYIDMAIISGGTTLGATGGLTLGLSTFGGGVTRGMLQVAAADAGPTIEVVTKLTQAPQLGRGLSVATGEGATALANAARTGGRIFTARIPKALIETLKTARLVEERVTMMNGVRAVELRFRPEAAEFIIRFFH